MQRIPIIVPTAGTVKEYRLSGCGIIVESSPIYATAGDVPLLIFNDENGIPQPIYPQAKYFSPHFTRFYIRGTSQSEGDVLYFLLVFHKIEETINPVFEPSSVSTAGVTQLLASTDVAQYLPDSILYDTGVDTGKKCKAVLISCDTNKVKYAIGTLAVQGGVGHTLSVGDYIRLEGFDYISSLTYISDAFGVAGNLNITPEY